MIIWILLSILIILFLLYIFTSFVLQSSFPDHKCYNNASMIKYDNLNITHIILDKGFCDSA